jgi:hypothetical protein
MALVADPHFAEAHQGLARALTGLGEDAAAEQHWRLGFAGRAIVAQPYRGIMPAIPLLLLVSAKGGNIPTRLILDDKIFRVVALYAEFYDPMQPLPPHALVFNAIGDADFCTEALDRAEELLARTTAPVINSPSRVRVTGRVANARRLAKLRGVVVPWIRSVRRSGFEDAGEWTFPLLLRATGFHTGQHFLRVNRREDLASAVAGLPGDRILVLEYLDVRDSDSMVRKYRVMFIDGVLYPLHLAISADWKVHYFTADMAANDAHREEERQFLDNFEAVLGAKAITALGRISRILGLDYAGIDFGLDRLGAVVFFEANATMVVVGAGPEPIWDYRRAAVSHVLEAVKRMLLTKAVHPRGHTLGNG